MKTFKEFIQEGVDKIKVFTGPLGQKTSKISDVTVYSDSITGSKFNLKSHLKEYESDNYTASFSGRKGTFRGCVFSISKKFTVCVWTAEVIHYDIMDSLNKLPDGRKFETAHSNTLNMKDGDWAFPFVYDKGKLNTNYSIDVLLYIQNKYDAPKVLGISESDWTTMIKANSFEHEHEDYYEDMPELKGWEKYW
jgi:hypothetical protein